MSFKVILSDLDGVLRNYPADHSAWIEREFGLAAGHLLSIAFQKKLLEPAVTGRISDELWRENIATELAGILPAEKAREAVASWSMFPGSLDTDVLELYKSMKSGCRLALLTNATSRLTQDLRTLGVLEVFDVIFNTSEIGFAKPDTRAFTHAIEKLGCAPEEILFIDDRIENIRVAEELGMKVHLFSHHDGLRSTLFP